MTKRIILWLNAFFACGHFAGHLFDTLVIVPNWKSGSVEAIMGFRGFFVNTDPGAYFAIFVMGPTLLAIVSFVTYIKSAKPLRNTLAIVLLLTLISTASTFLFFFPINNYLFWGGDNVLDPTKTMDLVNNWVSGERIRLALAFIILLFAGKALHLSYPAVK
jgi:hypothetical protein